MKLWCQKWRFLLRKSYDPSRILLGDFLHILATLSQPEGIPWSISSLIHQSSGFFHGYLFYNAWREQSHKIGETLPGFTNSTDFMVMGMAISASMVLFHWRTIDHCLISSGCWMLHFILRPDEHLGATILQVTLQQDWSTLGMRYGQQGDITSIFINVGHNGITNRELDMFALRKIQLERWWVFSNFVMCEMAGQCHGSAMELISTWLIQVADNICNKYTAFDVCWHNYTITSYLLWNSPSKVILLVHHTIIWQTC